MNQDSRMTSDDLAVLFRKAELLRRQARRQVILNEEELAREELSPHEQAIHDRAIGEIKRANESLERELRPTGYWLRLKAAAKEFCNALWRMR